MPEFDAAEAGEKFDEENPEVEIPDEIVDDINNDWVLDEAENEALIAKYNADKNGTEWGGSISEITHTIIQLW